MSDANDHQRLLQILEAHGQQFLNSFEQPKNPANGKRKPDDSPCSGEEDEEWHGFRTGDAGSGDSGDGESVDYFHGTLHFLMPDLTSTYG